MMKLLLSIGIYYLIELIGLCGAMPIPADTIAKGNMFVLGAIAFMTFGAVLAGCVCCRRRKKGFEPNKEKDPKEFTNESEGQRQHGVPSIAITEATASTDTTRSTTPAAIVVVSIPVVNNSNENLIVDANDNNNGPISPADLENIENNNAFDYIQNQNEIGVTVEPTAVSDCAIATTSRNENVYSINEISMPTSTQNEIQLENLQYQIENINNNNNNNNNNDNNNHQQNMPNNDINNQAQFNTTQDIVITSTTNDINNDSKLYSPNEISNENNIPNTTVLLSNENHKNIIKNLYSNSIINAEIHSIDEKSNKLNQFDKHNQNENININDENCLNNKIIDENVPIFMLYQNEKNGNNFNDNDLKYNNILKNIDNSTLLLNEINEETPKNEDVLISKVLLAGLEDTSDKISIKSVSSDKSNEISSVEEALRVLDIAIDGCLDDDIDDIVENDEKVQNEIIIENEINNQTTEILNDMETDDNYNNHIENVRIEAEELVDSVLNDRKKIIELVAVEFVDSLLNDSKNIIEDKAQHQQQEFVKITEENLNSESEENLNQSFPLSQTSPPPPHPPSSTNQTIAVNYFTIETNNICPNDILLNCAHDFDEMMLMKQKQKIQKQQQQPKTEFNTNTTNTTINFKQKLAEQFDDFFSNGMIASSTPSIQNKFLKKNEIDMKKSGIKLKFNDNENLISPTTDLCTILNPVVNDVNKEMIEQNVTYNANATYNAGDETFNVPAADKTYNAVGDATFNTDNKNIDETFDINKTYDTDQPITNKDDFTYPGDPCTSKQAIERDQFLRPLIKYQREEVTSDELNTITPVNTPIELNYNQETWNKMTKPNDDELKTGWFLHPQQLISTDNGLLGDGDCNPITQLDNNCNDELICNPDETYDIDEEDSRNLESTFEALRKQLAEVLPQPQGMAGPPEFSDDEDDQQSTRTFDEYRSPLDGIYGLLEIDSTTLTTSAQNNEVVINYNNKRPLSPIIEESEEETCKTFVLNETKCLDSTSTGCIETGEAIMGVTKTLMASNDTLFNFEDTLGDKEDVFSPRVSSRSDSQATTPVKTSGKSSSTANSSVATTISSSDTEKNDYQNDLTYIHSTTTPISHQQMQQQQQREPPKTLNFIDINDIKPDNDFCSPDQQKTFSDGTQSTSTTTDRLSSSLSPTLDNETTFTLNTIDDKTCITVIIKDDERISEISEPEWGGSTTSNNIGGVVCAGGIVGTGYDMNSLTDIPSLDFNVNTFDKEFEISENLNNDEMNKMQIVNDERKTITSLDDDENTDNGNDEIAIDDDIEIQQKDSGHDDSGHSTQASTDKSNNTSHNISVQETDSIEDDINNVNQYNQVLEFNNSSNNILNIIPKNITTTSTTDNEKKENCKEFLQNEIIFSSNLENSNRSQINNDILNDIQTDDDDNDDNNKKSLNIMDDSSKENSDPNVIMKILNNCSGNVVVNNGFDEKLTSLQKVVQMNNISHDNVINNDKINNISSSEYFDKEHYSINESGGENGIDFYQEKTKTDVFVQQVDNNNKIEIKQDEQITPTSSPLLLNNTNNYENCCGGGSSNIEIIGHLSGEEDPWAETLNDIRFTGPRSADIISNSSEWDSDVDDSHSSEEFMYVRGDGVKANDETILKYIKENDNNKDIIDDYNDENNKNTIDDNTLQFDNNVKENFQSNLWSSHRDKIPVSVSKGNLIETNIEEEAASEGSSSELEGEFIPSCWDSMATPSRSALKSPDKTNSSSDNKKCRSVVFKKQRYHSVYEYPRENSSLSPAFNGSNIWQNKNYVFKNYENENTIEKFNDDGFVISSSSRPFHGSQFNALCHTWPPDTDFSWSQIDPHEKYDGDEKKLSSSYSDIDLKWSPQPMNDEIEVKDVNKSDENHRPDSGVGESAEMLSDRQSLGELCHTKTKLRLPIEEKIVLSTPSCTGSMDSLSSSSSINSELQQQINQQEQDNHQPEKQKLNFSTFGKRNSFPTTTNDNEKRVTINDSFNMELKNDQINKPAINIILIDEINNTNLIQNNCSENFSNNSNNLIMKTDKIKQSDSTDEDSGIESIMRINKID